MKIETIKCDRCYAEIPDGPPNVQYNQRTVNAWSSDAVVERDLCTNCNTDYMLFLANSVAVNPR